MGIAGTSGIFLLCLPFTPSLPPATQLSQRPSLGKWTPSAMSALAPSPSRTAPGLSSLHMNSVPTVPSAWSSLGRLIPHLQP